MLQSENNQHGPEMCAAVERLTAEV